MTRIIFLSLVVLFFGCDHISPKRTYKIVIPEKDYSYNYSAQHLKEFLGVGGFNIEIVYVENAIEANKLVAEGSADLTFVNNNSAFIPAEIGGVSRNLRTVLPMFNRLFFVFAKELPDQAVSVRDVLKGKTIGIEVLNGETHYNLREMLKSGKLDSLEIVLKSNDPDFIHFWGTYYGERAQNLLEMGWKEVEFRKSLIEYYTLNDPALSEFLLPAIPGISSSRSINTLSVQTLLVCNKDLGLKSIYELTEYILQHRIELMRFDKMYRSLDENTSETGLLYPIHDGSKRYLDRDKPSFFERYAELIALIISVLALAYGLVQTLRARLVRIKKERIDIYFLELLEIRENSSYNLHERFRKEDLLHQKAVVQMTNEKLDKDDFHIFSRLIQQEMSLLSQKINSSQGFETTHQDQG